MMLDTDFTDLESNSVQCAPLSFTVTFHNIEQQCDKVSKNEIFNANKGRFIHALN